MTEAAGGLVVRPVTEGTWADFERLFSARGSPHFCWCMIYRSREAHLMSKEQKRDAMKGIVESGTPVGLLAYAGDEPVGWCSVAPRETFPKLARSKAMPSGDTRPAWTVTCFFVRRSHRGRRVTATLLAAAMDYARGHGGAVIEGYPWDTSANRSRFKGHSAIFRAAGFHQEGTRWFAPLQDHRRTPTAVAGTEVGGDV